MSYPISKEELEREPDVYYCKGCKRTGYETEFIDTSVEMDFSYQVNNTPICPKCDNENVISLKHNGRAYKAFVKKYPTYSLGAARDS